MVTYHIHYRVLARHFVCLLREGRSITLYVCITLQYRQICIYALSYDRRVPGKASVKIEMGTFVGYGVGLAFVSASSVNSQVEFCTEYICT